MLSTLGVQLPLPAPVPKPCGTRLRKQTTPPKWLRFKPPQKSPCDRVVTGAGRKRAHWGVMAPSTDVMSGRPRQVTSGQPTIHPEHKRRWSLCSPAVIEHCVSLVHSHPSKFSWIEVSQTDVFHLFSPSRRGPAAQLFRHTGSCAEFKNSTRTPRASGDCRPRRGDFRSDTCHTA